MGAFYNLLNTMIGKINSSVKVEAQTLTAEQKAQVRSNIGAMPDTYVPPTQTAEQVGADPAGTAAAAVAAHNSAADAHSDIRGLISGLTTRLNTLADSDDTTLDQLSEIVAYIKANKGLIEGVTTSKVNVADIIDNLTSTDVNKPLSANQGKVLKDLIDAIEEDVAGAVAASDIVDNLTTDDATKVLSAKQGKALKGLVDETNIALAGKPDLSAAEIETLAAAII